MTSNRLWVLSLIVRYVVSSRMLSLNTIYRKNNLWGNGKVCYNGRVTNQVE